MHLKKLLHRILSRLARSLEEPAKPPEKPEMMLAATGRYEELSLALGSILSREVRKIERPTSLSELEFRIFSQWGDDGIIHWLVSALELQNKTFVEFGVQAYGESNTRFLLMSEGWSGLVMDGSRRNVEKIRSAYYSWMYPIEAKAAFVDAANIEPLLAASPFGPELDLLHIDIDGNDYWVWKAIRAQRPAVVIMEYNSLFGPDRAITVPYDPAFERMRAHSSGLLFGASLPALHDLATEKGYTFIGCNSAGNNAYFVRNDKVNNRLPTPSLEEGYVRSKFREGRDAEGHLTLLQGDERSKPIRGCPVFNTRTDLTEPF